jgi:phage repressor protein C with HTH and peptisase S24 domain
MLHEILDRIHQRLAVVELSAATASSRAGLSKDAIRNLERAVEQGKDAGASTTTLTKLAPVLGTTASWLIDGSGPEENSEVPLMGYVGAGAEVEPENEQVPAEGLDQIALPIQVPSDMIAFKVRGDSMLPAFKDGSIIVVRREQQRSLESFYGEEAAVRTSDGRRFIKTIMRGRDGYVNLMSWNARAIEDVRLEWIGEIFAILPPSAMSRAFR